MELNFHQKEKIVGFFMVVLMALLLTTIVMVGRGKDWFKEYVTYYTVFKEAYNLSPNAVVKLYKADIGKVKKIVVEEDRVKVELAILDDYAARIRADSLAVVESPTVIGSEYVSIKPGTADAPPIPPEGLIPSQEKKSLKDILAEFEVEKTSKMVIAAAQDISEMIGRLQDPAGPLFTSLNNISRTLVHVERITGGLEAGKGSLGILLRSEVPLKKLYDEMEKVAQILENVESATRESPYVMANIKEAVDIVHRTLKNIEEGSYDVPKITKATKRGVQEIRDTVEEIDKAVTSAQKNFLIRSNLPRDPEAEQVDIELRK
jgi:phospholipid/cholesterol/gamma-HCH transport system substrate-binding protein